MKYAIIENDIVKNIAVSDHPLNENWIQSNVARKGDLYDPETGAFTRTVAPVQIPNSITDLQAMLAIDQLGYTAQYEAWASDPARTFVEKAYINRAKSWLRTDAVFNAAADEMEFSEQDKDNFFILAAEL